MKKNSVTKESAQKKVGSKRSIYTKKRKQDMTLLIRNLVIAFSIMILISLSVSIFMYIGTNETIKEMHSTYIKNTDDIILTSAKQKLADEWERLPEPQKREKLRAQYTEIVTYYTINTDSKYKMSAEQINSTFNKLYDCLKSVPRINFFMAVAYMKVATNFNPVYNREYKYGLAAMYLKTGEAVSNLPRIEDDKTFYTAWKGMLTLNRPDEAIKLLVARIDDLMLTFNNREEWVFLSLFTNEYDVIGNYWNGGEGIIPDDIYREGKLAEVLKYYNSFKNWEIPARDAQ